MAICSFFLQGRCRYGDKCWNEHPRGGSRGGGGGHNNNYSRSSGQQQPRGGGGGFGNKVWVNPNQQKGAYIQPSSFSSHGSSDWGRGSGGGADWGRGGGSGEGGGGDDWGRGGGRRDNVKSSEFNLSSQNRGGRGGGTAVDDDDDKKIETIQMDMEIWDSSGQWGFSCYSCSKTSLSGFADLSPEELRLEYYTTRASGDVQSYVNGVSQLLSQWRSRVQELKVMNPATRAALLAELNNPAPQASSGGFGLASTTGFGPSTSDFGSKGFGAPATPSFGFGSSGAPSTSASFGSTPAAPTQPPSGFGSSSAASSAPLASTFSFTVPPSNKPEATSGFGSASGFSFSSTANTGGGFGSGFGAAPAPTPATAQSSSIFEQASGGFGTTTTPAPAGAGLAGGSSDSLFSLESKLTPEELNQFKAKRFTLGQIPLKPPPANMLIV
ncbi:nucleoporin NUP42 [Mastacembelus armatus]|uniref:nucleoporin NUP42 n=1 Tax=Mastacembelus armatus TaxID=205130 RepID=UPI000E4549F9|nr:nucleoporin NUP42 [Mastacembelus armatus]